MPTIEDTAYTAGLFDGEGSISLAVRSARRGKNGLPTQAPALYLQLSSTNKEIIDWVKETWGAGSVFCSYRPKRPTHRTAYTWRLSGNNATIFLEAILPYLKIKREQALLGIKVRQMIGSPGHKLGEEAMRKRLEYRDRMIELNGRLTPRLKF